MRTALALALSVAVLAACTTVPARPRIELTEQQARGYTFAKTHCAACHGITANASSPNPEAPPFEMVVNKTGLNARSLELFLRDSHSFPGQMDFEIDPAKIDDLTAYMITMRRPGYNPPI
jgi:mono/diheme cytochrome c family protein